MKEAPNRNGSSQCCPMKIGGTLLAWQSEGYVL